MTITVSFSETEEMYFGHLAILFVMYEIKLKFGRLVYFMSEQKLNGNIKLLLLASLGPTQDASLLVASGD